MRTIKVLAKKTDEAGRCVFAAMISAKVPTTMERDEFRLAFAVAVQQWIDTNRYRLFERNLKDKEDLQKEITVFDLLAYGDDPELHKILRKHYIRDLEFEPVEEVWDANVPLVSQEFDRSDGATAQHEMIQFTIGEKLYQQNVRMVCSGEKRPLNWQAFQQHPRNAALVNKNPTHVLPFRDLSKEQQLALIHYMSVDGAAWAVDDEWSDWEWGEGAPDPKTQSSLRKRSLQDCKKFLPRFIREYGDILFGVTFVPRQQLIDTIRDDVGIAKDVAASYKPAIRTLNFDDWEYESPTWPVILSGFPDETLQDGWTRFYRYCKINKAVIQCLFYVNPVVECVTTSN